MRSAEIHSFDTHKFIKQFQKVGFEEAQAETIVKVLVETRDFDLSTIATKPQVENVRQELKQEIVAVRKDLDGVRQELKQEIAAVRKDLDGVRLELKQDIEFLRQDFKQEIKIQSGHYEAKLNELAVSMIKWYVGTTIAMAGIIGAVIKFIY